MKRAGTTRPPAVKTRKAQRNKIRRHVWDDGRAHLAEPTGHITRRGRPQPTTWDQCTLDSAAGEASVTIAPPPPLQMARQDRGEGGGARRAPRLHATRVLGGCTLRAAGRVCKGESLGCVVDSPTGGRSRMATTGPPPRAPPRRRRMHVVFLLISPGGRAQTRLRPSVASAGARPVIDEPREVHMCRLTTPGPQNSHRKAGSGRPRR